MSDINAVKEKYAAQIEAASELRALDDIRVAALGKKGEIGKMMQGDIAAMVEAKKEALENAALDAALASETMDMSLPVGVPAGTLHPVQQVMEEMAVIF